MDVENGAVDGGVGEVEGGEDDVRVGGDGGEE